MRGNFVGFSATNYNSEVQRVLRSYKELGESDLAKHFAQAMAPLLSCFEPAPRTLIPIPSNRSAARSRGFNPAELLARELVRGNSNLTWINALSRLRETQDQSKLSPKERRTNQEYSMLSHTGTGRVLLVDDIVTTGATLLSARQALTKAGYLVEGFITFAETETKRCTLTTQAQLPADGGTSWN